MLVPLVPERLDMQVVGRVHILADLQNHRFRFLGPHIGPDDLGKLVADLRRDMAGVLLPGAVSLGRALVILPVFGFRDQDLRIALAEFIGPVLFLVLGKFLCGLVNIFWAVQFVDVFLEFSAVGESGHVLPLQ